MISEGRVVYTLVFAVSLFVAVQLDFKYATFSGDAYSRMANGFYILYSRDPHLAALGFVWTPLQSMADFVFLLGNHLWPDLSHHNMAASLVSSIGMAGAAYQILSALREWGVTRTPRRILVAFFALNPMILFYAGNGMSEGLYLFTLTASTRYLLRWVNRGDLRSLSYSAVALGFAYLTRNEAIMGALVGAIAVGLVSYRRSDGSRQPRARTAMSDLSIFAIPPLVAAAGWAVTSYVITGHFFEQYSSIYGNSAQERFLPHKTLHGRVLFEVHSVEALAPLLPILLIVAFIVAYKWRDPRILAPIAVLGGALGFDMLAYLDKSIESFFRYFIVTVPLSVLLVGSVIATLQDSARSTHEAPARTRRSRKLIGIPTAVASVAIVLLAMVPATVSSGSAMLNPAIGSEESQQIGFIFHAHPSTYDLEWKARFPQILALSGYFGSLHLPDGDIVTDNSTSCVPEMITTISQPRLFVIPNDRDFQRILADPIVFSAHYILEPNPTQTPVTAMNIQYPSLWRTGAGFTKLARDIPARGTCPEFRLFHVLHHSNEVS